jgi:HSP20 family protein
MQLMKWDPFREMEEITDRFSRALGRPFLARTLPGGGAEEALITAEWAPLVDIEENEKEYLVKAELPEVKKEDVKVTLEEGVLTIQGERRLEKEEKGKKIHRIERAYGKFLRTFTVPRDVDEKKILAEFKEGMLTVRVPKAEVFKPREIEVKVA